mmetsp:Transcript_45163/g.73574  ORF Transcript_45163/g.73574 Transcript_45163/m.73574 type:complete len:163 (+) Transcript_45163:109-597(+)|eukprot:CAMPEP_0184663302 /NCGR_PEP_ID=MMETSP0308-20130426/47596_1 /TAXON_ID=38269 /ORGANISM="Gloeochaete witrockiana, Strain SAG 46.84" /LENGTH=162 /DNA_ID=CAMNT_0027105955 /DNA_START=62 /DNA_END=550 /DNA_ORIENTATION=-
MEGETSRARTRSQKNQSEGGSCPTKPSSAAKKGTRKPATEKTPLTIPSNDMKRLLPHAIDFAVYPRHKILNRLSKQGLLRFIVAQAGFANASPTDLSAMEKFMTRASKKEQKKLSGEEWEARLEMAKARAEEWQREWDEKLRKATALQETNMEPTCTSAETA